MKSKFDKLRDWIEDSKNWYFVEFGEYVSDTAVLKDALLDKIEELEK